MLSGLSLVPALVRGNHRSGRGREEVGLAGKLCVIIFRCYVHHLFHTAVTDITVRNV